MRRIVGYASAILMMTTAVAASSEFVVIAADNGGKAYTPGAVVKAGSKIVLPAGARITLLAQSGKVVKLKGPHSGIVRASAERAAKGTLAAVAKLITSPDKSKTVGATRVASNRPGSGPRNPPADIWVVEADRAGRACTRGDSLQLWRPGSNAEAKIGVWHKTGDPKRLVWAGGNQRLELARTMVEPDMQLSIVSGTRSISIILSVLPAGASAEADGKLLQWLAARGCTYQARKLISHLHAGAAAK